MRRKATIILTGLLFAMFSSINAQTSNVAYFMNLPQSSYLNPALITSTRFYIGLPVLTGIGAGIDNNFLQLKDIVTPGLKADSIFSFQNPNFSLKNLASKLNKNNTISAQVNIQLLGIGFPVGRNFSVMIDVMDRFTSKVLFPKSLLDLYLTGGSDLIGQTIDISKMNVQGQFFRSYGAGFSGEIIQNLRIGARLNLLSGIGSLSFDDQSFTLKVNNDLSQTVTANATMETSGSEELSKIGSPAGMSGFLHDYIGMPLTNPGFSIDFGAEYNFGKLVTVSFSVRDLGFIKWKSDLQAWNVNGAFTLPGITLQDVQNQSFSIDQMYNSLADSVKSNFKQVASPQPFKTYLPTDITFGASFNPFKFISFGVLSVSKIYAGSTSESLTMSANAHLGQVFSASVAYSMENNSYNNLGVGLSVTAGVAQFYFIVDKIPMQWDKVYIGKSGSTDYTGIPLPNNFNTVNFQLGLNIIFGKRVAPKRDIPMLQSGDQTNQ
ncbi:MAG: DUF5723 family protein [Bacteroidales bacterium]|jgi:hypothetical protein